MSDTVLGSWGNSTGLGAGAKTHQWTRGGRLAVALLSLCLALAVGSAAMPHASDTLPQVEPAVAPPALEWLDIAKPVQVFSLQANEIAGLPLGYFARRRNIGDSREDVLAFGTLGGEKPALRLRIARAGSDARPTPSLYLAIERQAAETGLSLARIGLPDLMPTRFGAFEIADIAIAGSNPAQVPQTGTQACTGFRLIVEGPAMTITGFACGGASGWPRKSLACLLDRLDLVSGREDRPLVDFFAATELKRDGHCNGMRLAPDTVHAPWLDDKPATPRISFRHH